MKKQSGKKLVEILAVELKEWPKEVVAYFQGSSGEVFATSKGITTGFGSGLWYVVDSSVKMAYGCPLYDTELELAVDHDTAIVTREMWEAERAKLEGEKVMRACVEKCEPEIKPKDNAQGWIRHRGGKMPVSACKLVEIRTRGGEFEVCRASGFDWAAEGEDQIMAYRLHQPEQPAEPVEVKDAAPVSLPDGYGEVIYTTLVEVDGPLQWRDRVTEIDREVESLEEERESLIQKLADEGFKLIKREAVELPDMSDWRNWREGDLITCTTSQYPRIYTKGKSYAVKSISESGALVFDDLESESCCTIGDIHMDKFKFHSRPTK